MLRSQRVLTLAVFAAMAAAIIALLALNLTSAGGQRTPYQGDWVSAFGESRWYLDEHGNTRFALIGRQPTDLRCIQEEGPLAVHNCSFERHAVLDLAAPFDFQPLVLSPRFTNRPSYEQGLLWVVLDHLLAPRGAKVECIPAEGGEVIAQTRTVPEGGSIWCKAQFSPDHANPGLTIRVGKASLEVAAPPR